MPKNNSVGHAFSDHVFEERLKRKKDFMRSDFSGFFHIIPLLILCIVFVVMIMRLFTLQIVRADYYSKLSDANRIRTIVIPAPRGIIQDRNGIALVRNVPAFSVLKDKKIDWLTQDEALKKLAKGENVYATIKREYINKDIFAHVVGYVGQIDSRRTPKTQ